MAGYADWYELRKEFQELHKRASEMRAQSIAFFDAGDLKNHWQLRGNRGNERRVLSALAEDAAVYAGQGELKGKEARDWWLDRLKSYLLKNPNDLKHLPEPENEDVRVQNVTLWPGHAPGEQKPPPGGYQGQNVTIYHVCQLSADYCLEWAKESRKKTARKPGQKADEKIQERKEIVKDKIRKHSDFHNPQKFRALLEALDQADIPYPRHRGQEIFNHPWRNVQDNWNFEDQVIELLNRDRWEK